MIMFLPFCFVIKLYHERELVAKNALASSSLPTYLLDWVNVFSSLCVYTTTQTTKFPESHLRAAGWYFDCSVGFVYGEKNLLFASLVGSVPEENIVTLEEPDIVELPLLLPRHPSERAEQRRPPLKSLPKLSLGLLQRPSLSHPPFHIVHQVLPSLLHQLSPMVLSRPLVNNSFSKW